MINKEFGSDFHWVEIGDFRNTKPSDAFVNSVDQLFFSGRAALYHLLKMGISKKGWKKLYVPTYYCHEVYHFLQELSIEIVSYSYNPVDDQLDCNFEDHQSNVVLIVNYFGIKTPQISAFKQSTIIEDLTHDLSKISTSQADYVFGSLRKILPVPVGGFLKSNQERLENINISYAADLVATQKFTGMFLKSKYLKGELETKEIFRELLIDGEQHFENLDTYSAIPLQTVEYMKTLNIQAIIHQKISNIEQFKNNVKENDYFELFTSDNHLDYAVILNFKNPNARFDLKNHLVNHKIYPMVLWPNQQTIQDQVVEQNLLFIHMDFRYNQQDVAYMAKIINDFTSNKNV